MTQSAVADLVLLLRGTKCKKIYFIGAIGGLAKGLKIGDVVLVNRPHYIHSVNSIHDETKKNLLAWRKKGRIGIDFENVAFFRAAKKARLKPAACYLVSDLPLSKPFYTEKSEKGKNIIADSLREIIAGICFQKK